MPGLIFFFFLSTAISSLLLTVNASFNILQPPEFGRHFLLGYVLLSDISVSSFFKIMNFYCLLHKNYNMKQWHKNEPKVVSLFLPIPERKMAPIQSTRK